MKTRIRRALCDPLKLVTARTVAAEGNMPSAFDDSFTFVRAFLTYGVASASISSGTETGVIPAGGSREKEECPSPGRWALSTVGGARFFCVLGTSDG